MPLLRCYELYDGITDIYEIAKLVFPESHTLAFPFCSGLGLSHELINSVYPALTFGIVTDKTKHQLTCIVVVFKKKKLLSVYVLFGYLCVGSWK